MPKVSVIIPVYNVEKYLCQCLDSLINQTLKDIEIICVDDGSTDNSIEILKEYDAKDSRFIVVTQGNKGAGAARNAGLEFAKGEYLYFMDGDDYLKLDALEKVYQRIVDTNAEICVFENSVYHQSTGVFELCNWKYFISNIPDKETFNKYDIPNVFFQFCNIPAWTKMYKASFIKDNEIEFQNLRTCNDVYFNSITLALADSITFLNESLITWRTDHSSTTATRGNHIACVLEAYKAIKDDLSKDDFKLLSDSFYKKAKGSFAYELGKVEDSEQRKYWEKRLNSFLPWKYRQSNFYTFLERVFSIKNRDEHKVFYVAGIKMKFKNKHAERGQYAKS